MQSARCIDWLSFNTPIRALSFTRSGEFLATSHVDSIGVKLFRDRSFVETREIGQGEPNEAIDMEAPVTGDDDDKLEDDVDELEMSEIQKGLV